MGSFEITYPFVKKAEGGQVNDPNDLGGNTYCGITQKNYPHVVILGTAINIWDWLATKPYKYNQIFPELNDTVKHFYKTEFWDKVRGDEIIDQTIATETVDMAINKGLTTAIKLTQEAAGIEMTGKMDDATLNSINNPTV